MSTNTVDRFLFYMTSVFTQRRTTAHISEKMYLWNDKPIKDKSVLLWDLENIPFNRLDDVKRIAKYTPQDLYVITRQKLSKRTRIKIEREHFRILDEHKTISDDKILSIMKLYGLEWPIFSNAIVHSKGMDRYWLQQLLNQNTGLSNNSPSVLSVIPVENIIEWCYIQPDIAPVFVARCLNVFDTDDQSKEPSPLFIALLENFGNDIRVASELNANTVSRGWSGSLVPYLESDKSVLSQLIEHKNANVRHWVKDHIAYLDRKIAEESKRDEEYDFGRY